MQQLCPNCFQELTNITNKNIITRKYKFNCQCENCGRGTIINYNATSLPITEWIKECGILIKFCELCRGNTVYIPYPINY